MADLQASSTLDSGTSAAAATTTTATADHRQGHGHDALPLQLAAASASPASSHSQSNARYSGSSQFSDDALSDIYAHHYRHSAPSSDSLPLDYSHLDDDEGEEEEEEEAEEREEQIKKVSIPDHSYHHLDDEQVEEEASISNHDKREHDHFHNRPLTHHDPDRGHDNYLYHQHSPTHELAASLPSTPRSRGLSVSASFIYVVSHLVRPASVDSPSRLKHLDIEEAEAAIGQASQHDNHPNNHHNLDEALTRVDNPKPSTLLIPETSAVSTTSWLLDRSASPTIVPRDLDR